MSAIDERPDDLSIPATDRLFRRIPPSWMIEDEGVMRPSSAAFKDPELSVYIGVLLAEQQRRAEDVVAGSLNRLVSVLVADVRATGYGVIRDTAPPHDPAHGLVLGKKSKEFTRRMTRGAVWVVGP